MKTAKMIPLYSVAAFALAFVSHNASADVIYENTFASSSDRPLQTYDIHANFGTGAIALSETSTDFTQGPIISSGGGGQIFYRNVPFAGQNMLIWTEDLVSSLQVPDFSVTEFSLSLRNDNPSENLQIALKIDGNWYVSQSTYNVSTASVEITHNITLRDVEWLAMTFIPGAALSTDASAILPLTGVLEAWGIYDANVTGSAVRITDVQIQGVVIPEPSAFGVALLAGIAVFWVRNSRKKAIDTSTDR